MSKTTKKTIANKTVKKPTAEAVKKVAAEATPIAAVAPKRAPKPAKKVAAEAAPVTAVVQAPTASKKTASKKSVKKPTAEAAPVASKAASKKATAEAAPIAVMQPQSAPNKPSDKKIDVAAYWTPERMRNATLHPSLRIKKPTSKAKPKAKVKGAPEKLVKPSLPTKRAAAVRTTFDTSLVPDVRDYPAATIGKIFLTSPEGHDYYATGFVVGQRCVFTVASVLWSNGSWCQNVVFYPQYNNGPGAGLGRFDVMEMWVAANWQEQGGLLNDFGALITSVPIQDFTGSVGLMANYPINQGQYLVMGYPLNPVPGYPFDGERMWQSTSAYLGDVAWIIQAGGNMTYGAHGAPWLIFREGGWYANGIFAVQVVNPDSMLSPYFGNEVWNFFSYLAGKGYT